MGKTTAIASAFARDKSKQAPKSIRNKNISKRDFDKIRKTKKAARVEKVKLRKDQREKELALKKAEKKMKKGGLKAPKRADHDKDDEEWEEVDEHEKDVFDKDGYFDVPEEQAQISANDEKLLKTL
jgi:hypothetical protein